MAALTLVQKQTLKAFILADQTLADLATATEYSTLAGLLNAAASPVFWCWKTLLTKIDAVSKASVDATTFSWSIYIARSQGERDAWAQIWNTTLSVNPSLDNVRAAFADIFSGAPGLAQRTHLLAMARRTASVAEKVLASGTGSTASPGLFGWEGTLIAQEMAGILAS